MTLMPHRRTLSRQKTLDFLGDLAREKEPDSYSLYLTAGHSPVETENNLKDINLPFEETSSLAKIIDKSPTGAIVFGNPDGIFLLIPPFPIAQTLLIRELDTENLESILTKDHTIGLVLVRLGAYGVGVCRGENLVSSKVGTGNIHARHKKGGSSAHRFERRRDKQIEYFLTRVCQRAREHLEPHLKALDYLVYSGARETIRELQKQCDFLGKLKTTTLPPLLDIPDPRLTVLKDTVRQVWSSTLYEWHEAD